MTEAYTDNEKIILDKFFTNTDLPVFGLINLTETVKGALFARYSRTHKPLRRLFLDEFAEHIDIDIDFVENTAGITRAEKLYDRVFLEYGDDSVAQLGGAHIACENVSNVLSKILERGRLMSYLEKSTRYLDYSKKTEKGYRYVTPKEISDSDVCDLYAETMQFLFDTYSALSPAMASFFTEAFPQSENDTDTAYTQAVKAKVYDSLRGLLPASTETNIGIYGSGQGYENMLIRMFANPLLESQDYAQMILQEARQIFPSFMKRVDMSSRGKAWSGYISETKKNIARLADDFVEEYHDGENLLGYSHVNLVRFDKDGEQRFIETAIVENSCVSFSEAEIIANKMSEEDKRDLVAAYIGERGNRRHKPGRALESSTYLFEIVCDYGAFRDLQRHRLLSIDWQTLGCDIGYSVPDYIKEAEVDNIYEEAMSKSETAWKEISDILSPYAASYVVPLGYSIRFYMHLNAREAMHIIELRTMQSAHESYRQVAQKMLDLIEHAAGHKLIASSMSFAGRKEDRFLERLESEKTTESKKSAIS